MQSSSAISLIIVSLVGTGAMTFSHSIPVLMGANIGSTVTAQLVALKLTNIAPYLLVIGYILNFLPGKSGVWGKPIFYFGLLFLGLSLLSSQLDFLKEHELTTSIIMSINSVYWGILVGAILTILLQSSSVTSSLVIVFAIGEILPFELAASILIGSNIGTTTTALIGSINLGREARMSALANTLINLVGVVVVLPFLSPFINLIGLLSNDVGQRLANVHILFNIFIIVLLFPFRDKIEKLVIYIMPLKSRQDQSPG